jgi:hypothetical protein
MTILNKEIELVFYTIKYSPKNEDKGRKYLILGWDFNIDEIVYTEHSTLHSRNDLIKLDNVWDFTCEYSKNYKQITGLSKGLSNNIFVVQCIVEANDSFSGVEWQNYIDDLKENRKLKFWSYIEAPKRSVIKIYKGDSIAHEWDDRIEKVNPFHFVLPNKSGVLNVISYIVNIGQRIEDLKNKTWFIQPISITKTPVDFSDDKINKRIRYTFRTIFDDTTDSNLEFNDNLGKYNKINFTDFMPPKH